MTDETNPQLPGAEQESAAGQSAPRSLGKIWESVVRMGLGEIALRIVTGVALIAMVLLVVWVMSSFYLKGDINNSASPAETAAQATATGEISPVIADVSLDTSLSQGITRQAQLHTILPSRSRFDVVTYTVAEGDTIFGIAEKFGLQPETILWGNYDTLYDDPHLLIIGTVLNILPTDGVYYKWHAGDRLTKVAKYYGVTPEDIINWPGNHLSAETIGDYDAPNIAAGTWLVVPGGTREFISWSVPQISRANPATATILGPGACTGSYDGPVGTGTYTWPSTEHWLSGYDFSPSTNHYGIDIAGRLGNPIYAVDAGVVVYAGWNDLGYGNLIVIDHGNGYQTMYAHLMDGGINVGCGSWVFGGTTIGYMGSTGRSTGPHLHFEIRSSTMGRLNPWDYLSR